MTSADSKQAVSPQQTSVERPLPHLVPNPVTPPAVRIAIFGPRMERFILTWPVLFIALIPLEFAGLWVVGKTEIKLLRVISDIFLLGTIHSVLSFTLMLFIPEVREWFKTYGGGKMMVAAVKFAAVCALTFAFMFYTVVKINQSDPMIMLLAVILIHTILGQRHWVRQAQGLSLLYNARVKQSIKVAPDVAARFLAVERWEKLGFTIMTIATALISLSLSAGLLKIFPGLPMKQLLVPCIALGLFGTGLVLWCSWITPFQNLTNKFKFNLRTLLVTFHSLSLTANLGMRATHGLEFLALTGKMAKNSRISRNMLFGFFAASLVAVLIAAAVDLTKFALYKTYLWNNHPKFFGLWCFMATLDLTFTYMHYYTDAVMFRFKEDGVRRHIGPLLK